MEALRDAGLFSLLVPEHMGGAGLTVWELPPVIEAMARVDGLAGWTLALGQGLLALFVPPALFRDPFSPSFTSGLGIFQWTLGDKTAANASFDHSIELGFVLVAVGSQ